MIALFPLLVSNTISKNIVPGVAKVLENYLMVYGLESIMARARKDLKVDYRITNKKIVMKEIDEEHLAQFLVREILDEQSQQWGRYGQGNKPLANPPVPVGQTQPPTTLRNRRQPYRTGPAPMQGPETIDAEFSEVEPKKKEDKEDPAKNASVKVNTGQLGSSISLEPTWMRVEQELPNGTKTSAVVGVKVVPYQVKSDAALARMLMYDRQVGKIMGGVVRLGRSIERGLYSTWRKIWDRVPFTGSSDTPTGDPRKDILLKRNILRSRDISDVFVLANIAELRDDFYASAQGVKKVQNQGWGSFIVADDVNKRVAFCMNQLRGMCTMLPYQMLYQTFGQAKVFNDLEDAKRSAQSIFKMRQLPLQKIIGESMAQYRTEEFGLLNLPCTDSELIHEAALIDENLGSVLGKMSASKLKGLLPKLLKGKMKELPDVSNDKIMRFATRLNPDFKKSYILSKKVLANSSPEVSAKFIDLGAMIVAVRSSMSKEGVQEATRKHLPTFVKLFRRIKESSKPKDPNLPQEYYTDAVFGWSVIIGVMGIVAASYGYSVKFIASFVGMIQSGAEKLSDIKLDVRAAEKNMGDWVGDKIESAEQLGSETLGQISPVIAWVLVALLLLKIIKSALTRKR